MNISIVIPNYNGLDLLQKNIPKVISALNEYKEGEKELIIVDDASMDKSLEYLSNLSNTNIKEVSIRIIKNEKNLGFSPTVNKGVRSSTGEIIILLNSDVIPEKEFLNPLIKHFTDEKVFAVGCMDKSIEDNKIILRGRGIGKWYRGFLIHARGEVNKKDTLWVNGGSGAFRKKFWETLGGLNELYSPFYWEDIDLSYRALKAGYINIFENRSIVTHDHDEGSIKSNFTSSKVSAISFRNQIMFVWLNITDPFYLLDHLFWLIYFAISYSIHGNLSYIKGLLLAFNKIHKIILFKKNHIAKRVRSDKSILTSFNE